MCKSAQLKVRRFQERNLGREAEGSPLLEAVAKERLVKTWQAGKILTGEMWRLSAAP
jgi:hypothetical protein